MGSELANRFSQNLFSTEEIKGANGKWTDPMVDDYAGLKRDLTEVAIAARQYPVWNIKSDIEIIVPECQEYALHGEFVLDGELILEAGARLILEA